jgi:Response regulator containing CheY-like receiver, AAA-type ATPase, and DNA-binding domains
VRELASLVERAATLAPTPEIGLDDLPERVRAEADAHPRAGALAAAAPPGSDEEWDTLAAVEARYIRCVLEWTEGNKQRAAKILGIGRKTLYRKLDEQGRDDT